MFVSTEAETSMHLILTFFVRCTFYPFIPQTSGLQYYGLKIQHVRFRRADPLCHLYIANKLSLRSLIQYDVASSDFKKSGFLIHGLRCFPLFPLSLVDLRVALDLT